MYRTRRRALTLMSGMWSAPKPPRGGWHRTDPGDDDGDGTSGHSAAGDSGNSDAGKTGDTGKTPTFTGDFDPDKAKAAIAAARDGEKKARQTAKDTEAKLAAVLKAMGLGTDGKADPEEQLKALTDRAAAAEKRAAELATREAVRDAAAKHTANASELLDSTKFLSQLAELDPTSSDYGDKVAKLVAQAVKDNPAKYGTTPAKGGSGRSGSSDHTGGGTGRARAGLGAAIAARMTN